MKKILFLLFLILVTGVALFAAPVQQFTPYHEEPPFKSINAAHFDLGDYNNDGYPDLFIGGYDDSVAVIKLYDNSVNGFEDSGLAFSIYTMPFIRWVDFNDDGNLDLCIAGAQGGTRSTRVYAGDGLGGFTDIAAGFEGASASDMSWGDYDNDGDLDFALTGYSSEITGNYFVKIYRNDGLNVFTDIAASAMILPVTQAKLDWGDYDGDGDLDLLIAGRASGTTTAYTIIYRNDGSDVFTDSGIVLPGLYGGEVRWADIDNDGDLDFIITGLGTSSYMAKIYENTDGAGTFTEKQSLGSYNYGKVRWADSDGDGDLDLMIGGYNSPNAVICLYVNDGTGSFDKELTFNTAMGVMFEWKDADADGDPDLIIAGSQLPSYYKNAGGNNYSNDWEGFTPFENSSCAVGDLDNDGDKDFVMMGMMDDFAFCDIVLYENDYPAVTKKSDSMSGLMRGDIALSDIDNDGDLDIVAIGMSYAQVANFVAYKNNGNFSFINSFSNTSLGTSYGSLDMADYDGDGDEDAVITGWAGVAGAVTKIYENDGTGYFTETSHVFPGARFGNAEWGDYDKDGDQDLLICGSTSSGALSALYRNDGDSGFTEITVTGLPAFTAGRLSWGDYDNDGDLDILAIGRDVAYSYAIFENLHDQTADTFTLDSGAVPSPGLLNFYSVSSQWADFDNDGDLDIISNGLAGNYPITRVYNNDGTGVFNIREYYLPDVGNGAFQWADFDDNGTLDLLLSGSFYGNIYMNFFASANTPPVDGSGPMSAITAGNTVIFSWDGATDTETPAAALTYEIGLGDGTIMTATSDNLKAAAVFNGNLQLSRPGNVGATTTWTYHVPEDHVAGPAHLFVVPVDGAYKVGAGWALIFNMPGKPQKVALNAPTDASTVNCGDIEFTWNAATGADMYHLQVSSDATFATDVVVDAEDISSTSRIESSIPAGEYYWRVRGESLVFSYGEWSDARSLNLVDPITAPTGLTASFDPAAAEIEFAWTDNSGNEDKFEVQYAVNASGLWNTLAETAGPDVTSLTVSFDSIGTWDFRVRGVNTSSGSDFSNTVTAMISGVDPYVIPNDVIWGHAKVYTYMAGDHDVSDAYLTIDGGVNAYLMEDYGAPGGLVNTAEWVSGDAFNAYLFSNGSHTIELYLNSVLYNVMHITLGELYSGVSTSFSGVVIRGIDSVEAFFYEPEEAPAPLTGESKTFAVRFSREGQRTSVINPWGSTGVLLRKEGALWEPVAWSTDELILTESGIYMLYQDSGYSFIPKVEGNRLKQNYPNPFNPETDIPYEVEKAGWVKLEIYDARGRKVITLVNEEKTAGYYQVHWNGNNNRGEECSSGIYYAVLTVNGDRYTKKMVMLK